ncbi:MAG: type II toxin-antitoxin system RelE/ParE family toxin [Desulfobacteraceae bacterium]|nr:MAG: type II toxin-antitoxin system RelE/ParE family toxin [Desulfobacteraceae bacterium]
MKKVIFYETMAGKSPVEDFLDSLSSKQAQKAAWVFCLIEELQIVPTKYLKKLVDTDDIWEVRIDFANDIFRFLGFFDGAELIILNHSCPKTILQ